MALFDRKTPSQDEVVSGSDAGTRALSVAAVENDFVEGVYDKLAKVYDLTFGPTLHPGRLQAIQRMNIQPGERVLEVGVGTGINLSLYPKDCSVTGIDFSSSIIAPNSSSASLSACSANAMAFSPSSQFWVLRSMRPSADTATPATLALRTPRQESPAQRREPA